jgi:hypothetical protein
MEKNNEKREPFESRNNMLRILSTIAQACLGYDGLLHHPKREMINANNKLQSLHSIFKCIITATAYKHKIQTYSTLAVTPRSRLKT